MKVTHSVAYKNKTDAVAEEIMRLIESGDWKETNKTNLAEQYDVSRKTVYLAEDKALQEIERQEVERSLIK